MLLASLSDITCDVTNLKILFRFYTQFVCVFAQYICILVYDHACYSTGVVTVSQQSPYLSFQEDLSALH